MRHGKRLGETGFTYVVVLAALAMFGLGLAALGESWERVAQRDKEQGLLLAGRTYVRAIESYYQRAPGTQRRYPTQLAELLEDPRYIGTERHLRRLLRDPVANSSEWGLVKNDAGEITGVYSLSTGETLTRRPLSLPGKATLMGQRYSDWKFVYRP